MATPAERRLLRILSDEDYGPKLARLRGDDEAYILRLIDQNKGKEARSELNRLDEERRERNRSRRRGTPRQPQTSRPISRAARERYAVENILRHAEGRANRARVIRNVKVMDDHDLDFAIDASFDDLIDRARRPAYTQTADGEDLNPFWYH